MSKTGLLVLTVITPDTKQAGTAAKHLRMLLKNAGITASVQEVTCYLEIARRGLKEQTPVLDVNGVSYSCKNLSHELLENFISCLTQY